MADRSIDLEGILMVYVVLEAVKIALGVVVGILLLNFRGCCRRREKCEKEV